MDRLFIVLCVAVVTIAQVYGYSVSNGYPQQAEVAADAGEYQYQSAGHDDASSANGGVAISAADGTANYGSGQNVGYQPANTRANSLSSCITYPNNKGEILIHRPAAIIVKRPPTKVVVNHPPLVVKPAPVVLHKPPAVVVRKVFVKHHPRPVKVEPVYVNVVKPPAEKYFVNEKQQASYAPQGGYAPVSVSAGRSPTPASAGAAYSLPDVENAAANAGYQLLQNNQGLAALANLSGSSGSAYDPAPPSHSSYDAPSY